MTEMQGTSISCSHGTLLYHKSRPGKRKHVSGCHWDDKTKHVPSYTKCPYQSLLYIRVHNRVPPYIKVPTRAPLYIRVPIRVTPYIMVSLTLGSPSEIPLTPYVRITVPPYRDCPYQSAHFTKTVCTRVPPYKSLTSHVPITVVPSIIALFPSDWLMDQYIPSQRPRGVGESKEDLMFLTKNQLSWLSLCIL